MQKISQIFRYPKAGLQFLDHEIADLPKFSAIYGPNGPKGPSSWIAHTRPSAPSRIA